MTTMLTTFYRGLRPNKAVGRPAGCGPSVPGMPGGEGAGFGIVERGAKPSAGRRLRSLRGITLALVLPFAIAACEAPPNELRTAAPLSERADDALSYIIGPGDSLSIFVYRAPELSVDVPVRPDGRISIPLVADIQASGRTPSMLSGEIEERLREFVREPNVTVVVRSFIGSSNQQIRIIGEAAQPRSIPFREGLTILDVLIQSGGLTRYAAGNRAQIVRREAGQEAPRVIRVRLADLLRNGDITQDVAMRPGDTVIIPQGWF